MPEMPTGPALPERADEALSPVGRSASRRGKAAPAEDSGAPGFAALLEAPMPPVQPSQPSQPSPPFPALPALPAQAKGSDGAGHANGDEKETAGSRTAGRAQEYAAGLALPPLDILARMQAERPDGQAGVSLAARGSESGRVKNAPPAGPADAAALLAAGSLAASTSSEAQAQPATDKAETLTAGTRKPVPDQGPSQGQDQAQDQGRHKARNMAPEPAMPHRADIAPQLATTALSRPLAMPPPGQPAAGPPPAMAGAAAADATAVMDMPVAATLRIGLDRLQRLDLHFTTASAPVAARLEQGIDSLQAELEAMGTQVERIRIEAAPDAALPAAPEETRPGEDLQEDRAERPDNSRQENRDTPGGSGQPGRRAGQDGAALQLFARAQLTRHADETSAAATSSAGANGRIDQYA